MRGPRSHSARLALRPRRAGRAWTGRVKPPAQGGAATAFSVRLKGALGGRATSRPPGGGTRHVELGPRQFQRGSLAGAARMWKDSACVQRETQVGQKPTVEQKGKSFLYFVIQYVNKRWKPGLSILLNLEDCTKKHFARGVRKVTTGITGLWRPRVLIDVAFWSFDVGSSYHNPAEEVKCRIVHPFIGNVSWV